MPHEEETSRRGFLDVWLVWRGNERKAGGPKRLPLKGAVDGPRRPQFRLPGDRKNPAVRPLIRLIFDPPPASFWDEGLESYNIE